MLIKPNKTELEGCVTAIQQRGLGADVDLIVTRNTSDPAIDFIQPQPGVGLRLYSSEPGDLVVGAKVRIEARLDGGPFGQRAILVSATPL